MSDINEFINRITTYGIVGIKESDNKDVLLIKLVNKLNEIHLKAILKENRKEFEAYLAAVVNKIEDNTGKKVQFEPLVVEYNGLIAEFESEAGTYSIHKEKEDVYRIKLDNHDKHGQCTTEDIIRFLANALHNENFLKMEKNKRSE